MSSRVERSATLVWVIVYDSRYRGSLWVKQPQRKYNVPIYYILFLTAHQVFKFTGLVPQGRRPAYIFSPIHFVLDILAIQQIKQKENITEVKLKNVTILGINTTPISLGKLMDGKMHWV